MVSKKKNKMVQRVHYKIGILGFGEVGQAIAKFYDSAGSPQAGSTGSLRVKIKDLKRDDGLEGVEILNVCIPWSNNFVKIVTEEIKRIKPKIVIIHSTVAPGATKKIGSLTKSLVVHSPIRGMHPNLYPGIKIFVKYIGADNKKAGELAKRHLESLGIKVKVFYPSAVTEALKLWDTTQYAWMIVLNKEIKKWCEEKGLNFEAIYTEANKSYNEGYQKLGRSEAMRPYLKYMPGKIGGHCVIPNCRILNSKIARFILKKNRSYGK